MADAVKSVTVYPKPGVSIYLPGGVHPFRSGPVPMRADHADGLKAHVLTEAQKKAADAAAKATPATTAPETGTEHAAS